MTLLPEPTSDREVQFSSAKQIQRLSEKLDDLSRQLSEEKKKIVFDYPSYETLRLRAQKTLDIIALLEDKVRRYRLSIKRLQGSIHVLRLASLTQTKNMSQHTAALGEATRLSLHDVLTGLPNRRLFDEHILLAQALSKRSGAYGAVLFLDLDKFKVINDRYGHAAGDALLIEVARRLNECVRDSDTVARFGGDEFAVLLPALSESIQVSHSSANIVAEKIRISLASVFHIRLMVNGKSLPEVVCSTHASVGGVLFHGNEKSPNDLLQIADSMMYEAKRGGGDGVRINAESMDD